MEYRSNLVTNLQSISNFNKRPLDAMVHKLEYSACEIRRILQQLFPERRLVLSQFTFFSKNGVAKATGESFRRGRRCYRLFDLLSIACVLALKEEGIPLKNIESVPTMIQDKANLIFENGEGCMLSGYGETVALTIPGTTTEDAAQDQFLGDSSGKPGLFWKFDVGLLALQLETVAEGVFAEPAANVGMLRVA